MTKDFSFSILSDDWGIKDVLLMILDSHWAVNDDSYSPIKEHKFSLLKDLWFYLAKELGQGLNIESLEKWFVSK
jgi:hypothetical protein